jgi:hypothetical protein
MLYLFFKQLHSLRKINYQNGLVINGFMETADIFIVLKMCQNRIYIVFELIENSFKKLYTIKTQSLLWEFQTG